MKYGDTISFMLIILNVIFGIYSLFSNFMNYFEIILLTVIISFVCLVIMDDRKYFEILDKTEDEKNHLFLNLKINQWIGFTIIMLLLIFGSYFIGFFFTDFVGDWESYSIEPDYHTELDETGKHEVNVTIIDVKKSSIILFNPYGGKWRFFERSYILVGEANRPYDVVGGFIDDLNREYNNSIEGHSLIISYTNTDGGRGSSGSLYVVDNITTDTGKFFHF